MRHRREMTLLFNSKTMCALILRKNGIYFTGQRGILYSNFELCVLSRCVTGGSARRKKEKKKCLPYNLDYESLQGVSSCCAKTYAPTMWPKIWGGMDNNCLTTAYYMSKYHFNNFGGSVFFSLPPKRFFARFLLRATQRTRRYITRYVWVSRDVGGACTGRRKSLGPALFSGAASPNQKRRHNDMKTEKGTLLCGVCASVSGLFSNYSILVKWRLDLMKETEMVFGNFEGKYVFYNFQIKFNNF